METKRLAKRFDDDIFDVLWSGNGSGTIKSKTNDGGGGGVAGSVKNTSNEESIRTINNNTNTTTTNNNNNNNNNNNTRRQHRSRRPGIDPKRSSSSSSSPTRVSQNRLFTDEDSHLFDLLGKDEDETEDEVGEDELESENENDVEIEMKNEENIGDEGANNAKNTDVSCANESPVVQADTTSTNIINDRTKPTDDPMEKEDINPALDRIRQEEVMVEKLSGEVERLRNVLSLEETLLEEETCALRTSLGDLQTLNLQIKEIEEEKKDIDDEIFHEMERCAEANFLLEAKQRKLIKELRNIYPIQCLPEAMAYSIAGIRLPNDIHSLALPDELVSAGLGYVCHLVSLISKYLSVPLRYRLMCNSSRSAVQDDDDLFPLFREKVVSRVQLDRAVVLLDRNVDLLLRAKGIVAVVLSDEKSSHILTKLGVFFEKMVEMDGDDEDPCGTLCREGLPNVQ